MFNIYCTKDVVEDNFTEGEIGKMFTTMYNSKIKSVKNLNECTLAICEYAECNADAIEIDDNNNTFITSRLETASGDMATDSEINRWKENKCQLFNAYFSFTITEENEVQLDGKFN